MPKYYSPQGNLEVWDVQPDNYLTLAEWAAAHPVPEPEPLTTDERFTILRAIRSTLLTDTDKHLIADYPISPEELVAIKTYRQLLRDLPEQPGAPWDGGGELTPWPELPSAG